MTNKIQLIIEADDQASTKFKRLVDGLEKGLDRTDKSTKRLERSTSSLGSTLKWAGGMIVTYFGVRALGSLASGFTRVASSFEKMEIQLDTLTKGKGLETLNELNEWAKKMPVNTEEAVQAFIRMKAMGLEPTIADMTTLVDTTSALGGETGTLEGISRALGQIQTKGKVSAEELMQLAERGIPAYEILQQKMGLTAQQVANIGNEGVNASEAVQALMEGMAERFGGQAERMQTAWSGMTEQLRSEWVDFNRKISEAEGLDSMKDALAEILSIIAELEAEGTLDVWAEAIGGSIATVMDAGAGLLLFFRDLGMNAEKALANQLIVVRDELAGVRKELEETGKGGLDELMRQMLGVALSAEELKEKIQGLEEAELALVRQISDLRSEQRAQTEEHTAGTDKRIEDKQRELENFIETTEEMREHQQDYEDEFEDRWITHEKMKLEGIDAYLQAKKDGDKKLAKEDDRYQKNRLAVEKISHATSLKNTADWAGAAITIMRAFAADSVGIQLVLIGIETMIKYWLSVAYAHAAEARALAEIPAPANIAYAAAVLAQGLVAAKGVLIAGGAAAAAAVITSQQHQEGGWIRGGSGVRDDVYLGTTRDQTVHLGMGGEFVVNRRQASKYGDLLEDINEDRLSTGAGGGQPIVIHNYITNIVELEGEVLAQFTKEIVYESSKAGEPIIHERGITVT